MQVFLTINYQENMYWLHNKALKISDVKRKKSSDDVGSRPRKYDQKRTKNI